MKKVDLNLPPANLTVMVHGFSGSGKTRFAGTFPKPRFLSDVSERGYETLRTMPRTEFYEPSVLPEVWGVESPKDMLDGIRETASDVREKKPYAPLTLVIDSVTFYANLYFDAMEKAEPPGKPDTRKLYGLLLQHLRRVMIITHEIPINVVWLALTKPPEDGVASVMVPGQSAMVLPAACQYYLFARNFTADNKGTTKFAIHTKPYGPFPARCRDGGTLPDILPEPTYRCLMAELTKSNLQQPNK